jgi:hypothetical protein
VAVVDGGNAEAGMTMTTMARNRVSRPTPWLWLIGLLCVTMWLGARMADADGYWYDEWWSLYNTGGIVVQGDAVLRPLDAGGVLARIAEEDPWQAPGYYLTLWAWAQGAGWSEFATRALSLLYGVLLVSVTYRLTRQLSGDAQVGICAALVASGCAWLTFYNHEARMYTLYALLTAAVLSAYLSIMRAQRVGVWRYGVFALLAAAMLYQHYFAAISLAALGVLHLGAAVRDARLGRAARWWGVGVAAVAAVVCAGGRADGGAQPKRTALHVCVVALLGRADGVWRGASARVPLAVLAALWLLLGGVQINNSAYTVTIDAYAESLRQPMRQLAAVLDGRTQPAQAILVHDTHDQIIAYYFGVTGRDIPAPVVMLQSNGILLPLGARFPDMIPNDANYSAQLGAAVAGRDQLWAAYAPHSVPARWPLMRVLLAQQDVYPCGTAWQDQTVVVETFGRWRADMPSASFNLAEAPAAMQMQMIGAPTVERTADGPRLALWVGVRVGSVVPANVYSMGVHLLNDEGALMSNQDFALPPQGTHCRRVLLPIAATSDATYSVQVVAYGWQTQARLSGTDVNGNDGDSLLIGTWRDGQ